MQPFGVRGEYDADDEQVWITLSFNKESDSSSPSWALRRFVKRLIKEHGEEHAWEVFKTLDMRIYSALSQDSQPASTPEKTE
jgi:hypothetical protein